jgi:hypothetical protein
MFALKRTSLSVDCYAILLRDFFDKRVTSVDRILIVRFGRFGNNVIQMINALQSAKILAVNVVQVPAPFLFFNESFTTSEGMAVVLADGSMGGTAIVSHFFLYLQIPSYAFGETNLLSLQLSSIALLANFRSISRTPRSYIPIFGLVIFSGPRQTYSMVNLLVNIILMLVKWMAVVVITWL